MAEDVPFCIFEAIRVCSLRNISAYVDLRAGKTLPRISYKSSIPPMARDVPCTTGAPVSERMIDTS
jgi:hypothetical protein